MPTAVAPMVVLEPEFLTLLLSQLKRGYAGLAVIERFNSTFCFSIQSLNFQIDPPVSGQPELKKSISQGGHRLIDYGITILVNSYYIKFFLNQFPLTGGHVMYCSFMRPIYVRSHSH
jgi:hypothetical protein